MDDAAPAARPQRSRASRATSGVLASAAPSAEAAAVEDAEDSPAAAPLADDSAKEREVVPIEVRSRTHACWQCAAPVKSSRRAGATVAAGRSERAGRPLHRPAITCIHPAGCAFGSLIFACWLIWLLLLLPRVAALWTGGGPHFGLALQEQRCRPPHCGRDHRDGRRCARAIRRTGTASAHPSGTHREQQEGRCRCCCCRFIRCLHCQRSCPSRIRGRSGSRSARDQWSCSVCGCGQKGGPRGCD